MVIEYMVQLQGSNSPLLTIYIKASLASEASRIAEAQYPGYNVVMCHPAAPH